jgi:hypothetical protein
MGPHASAASRTLCDATGMEDDIEMGGARNEKSLAREEDAPGS